MGKLQSAELRGYAHNGQLVSLQYKGKEIMHTAQMPRDEMAPEEAEFIESLLKKGAWKCSGIEMFPIIGRFYGPHRLRKNPVVLTDHGILRFRTWDKISENASEWSGSIYHNAALEVKGKGKMQSWPYSMHIIKSITLDEVARISYMLGDEKQPYQFGAHPAFRGPKDPKNGQFIVNGQHFTLEHVMQELMRKGSVHNEYDCYKLPGIEKIEYRDLERNIGFIITTKGFGNIALWTPTPDYTGMFCIEPETHHEVGLGLDKHSDLLRATENFEYEIAPFVF